jgi:cytochrome P450 family 2 subfamily U polypeptide 1
MDPAVWKDPTEFRPERFLNEHGRITGKENVIPFSLGRRSCLGELLAQQEIFLFLGGIVQNFVIEPPVGHETVELQEKISITVAPAEYKVRLIPRPI